MVHVCIGVVKISPLHLLFVVHRTAIVVAVVVVGSGFFGIVAAAVAAFFLCAMVGCIFSLHPVLFLLAVIQLLLLLTLSVLFLLGSLARVRTVGLQASLCTHQEHP